MLISVIFTIYFFRDPRREIKAGGNQIVAPADGKVINIEEIIENGQPFKKINIFLSIFDVHINRSPVYGKIKEIIYKKGNFMPAFKRGADEKNEQNIIIIENERGKIVVKQVAGIIARRILFWKKPNDDVKIGEKIGMIMFGSQTELKIPDKVKLFIKVNDKVKAGISIIGEWDEEN
jgi:phosphatidylserine decarboxylase